MAQQVRFVKDKQSVKTIGIIILFFLIGFGIYYNSLNNGFYHDDDHHIVKNVYIKSPGNIPLFFTEPHTFSALSGNFLHYRPLVLVAHSLNYFFGGLNPAGYHLVNLFFHIGSTIALFLILHAMLKSSLLTSAIASLLFLVNPFNSEVVNYITARSSVMYSFFCLVSFYFWMKYKVHRANEGIQSSSPNYFYIASFVFFLFAMLTKETAIVFPFILIVFDIYTEKASRVVKINKRNISIFQSINIWRYLPFVLTGFFIGFFLRHVFFGAFLSPIEKKDISYFNIFIKVKALGRYVFDVLFPVYLSVQHDMKNIPNFYFLLSLISILCLLLLAYYLWRNPDPMWNMASFFIIWFFIIHLPILSISLTAQYQENRGYLAGVGLIGVLAICMEKMKIILSERKSLSKVLLYLLPILIIIIYSAGTIKRNRVWNNGMTLWSDVARKYPESSDALLQVGKYYNKQGEFDKGESIIREALEIDPKNHKVWQALGSLYYEKKDLDAALKIFLKTLEFSSLDINTHVYLTYIYKEMGDIRASSKHLLYVLGSSPHNLRAYEMLIENYFELGEMKKVHDMMNRSVTEKPDNPGAHRALGLIYMYQNDWLSAQERFDKVLSYIPNDHLTLRDLGHVYSRLGKYDLAEKQYIKALSIFPGDPETSQALASLYLKQSRQDKALALYEAVLNEDPDLFRSYNNLGLIYLEKRDFIKAVEAFEIALKQDPDNYGARFNLVRVFESQGRKDLAKRELQKVLSATSNEDAYKEIYRAAQSKMDELK